MSLWLMLIGCVPVEPSWALLDPVAEPASADVHAASPPPTAQPSGAEQGSTDSRFAAYEEVTTEGEDGWGAPSAPAGTRGEGAALLDADGGGSTGDDGADADGAATAGAGAAGAGADGAATDALAAGTSTEPEGLPTQASWGVRLVQTLDNGQPPRAVLGLPDGREIIVSAGSMLPEVGLVVIAVGGGMIQLAQVVADGDHATIETTTLRAQYATPPRAAAE